MLVYQIPFKECYTNVEMISFNNKLLEALDNNNIQVFVCS